MKSHCSFLTLKYNGAPDQRQGSAITIYFLNPLFKSPAIHSLWLKISVRFSHKTAYLLSWISFITIYWSPAFQRESHVRNWFCPRICALTPALCPTNRAHYTCAHNLVGLELNYIAFYQPNKLIYTPGSTRIHVNTFN